MSVNVGQLIQYNSNAIKTKVIGFVFIIGLYFIGGGKLFFFCFFLFTHCVLLKLLVLLSFALISIRYFP